jgi:putative GTP pyrophosphokinase
MDNKQKKQSRLPNLSKTRTLYEDQLPSLEAALQSLHQEIRHLLERHGFSATIKYRVKRFEAYFDKLRKSRNSTQPYTSKPIGDFLALRIICPFLEDIEALERLLTTSFEVVETEKKSEQHSFREFGYDSVHLSIRPSLKTFKTQLPGVRNVCEIQLRTILQDAWAEVEHELVYKSDISLPKESIRRKLAALNASLTLSDLIFQEIRDYQKEIRQHGRKRRESLGKTLGQQNSINMTSEPPIRPKPIASTLKSRLEKTMLRALEAHSNHDLDTAIELYGVILGMKLKSNIRSLVYNHRGMAYFSLGNYRQAVKDFTQAINFDPDSDRSYANRGLCFRIMKRFDQSLDDFSEALRIDPNRPDACFGMAQTLFDMNELTKALIMCEKVLEISPRHKSALELIASITHNKGKPKTLL